MIRFMFGLCCLAAAAADFAGGMEAANELDGLPERAVFEVDRKYTFGLGGGAQWKVLGSKIRSGEYGKRVARTLTGGLPAFVFYDATGKEVAREEVSGMSNADIDAMLLKYGFFPGDTREPAAESVTPPSLAKPASGGSCAARQHAKKEAAAAAAAAQTEGQHTATQLAEAAAAAATAAAKAATAAAASAEAAVAALAAVQEGSCTA